MVDRKIDPFLFMRPDDKERMQMLIKHIKKEKEMSRENKKGDKIEKKNDVQLGRHWVDIKTLSEHIKFAVPTIREWIRLKKDGFPFHRPPGSRSIRFDLDEVDKWMDRKKESSG